MAWYVGGTAMTRSSSDSSLPDGSIDFLPPYQLYQPTRRNSLSKCHDNVYGDDDCAPLHSGRQFTPDHLAAPPPGSPTQGPMPPFYILKEEIDYPHHLDLDRHLRLDGLHPGGLSARPLDLKALPGTPPAALEQTSNGLSIASEAEHQSFILDDEDILSDDEAADRVEAHLLHRSRRNRDTRIERILKSLICPKSLGADFAIDDDALRGIFAAANELFFCGSLKGRVTWDWSGGSTARYQSKIIGTTALRKAASSMGGYETLIVLSRPILRNARYNRRLLISAFLHELIHSYMFICCGFFNARQHGGHTAGFRRIAALIDAWIGPEILFLCNMEADLDNFLEHPLLPPPPPSPRCNVLNSCHMHWPNAERPACWGRQQSYECEYPASWSVQTR